MSNINQQVSKRPEWSQGELDDFKKAVMKRIYLSWFLRKVLLPASLILPAAIFLLVKEISNIAVSNVINTALIKLSHLNLIGLFNFIIAAIRFTEIDGLLIMISSFLLALFFGRKIIREFYSYITSNPMLLSGIMRIRR